MYETAASTHTPTGAGSGEIITLNIQVGDFIYMDAKGNVLAIENGRRCSSGTSPIAKGIAPNDITSLEARARPGASDVFTPFKNPEMSGWRRTCNTTARRLASP